MTRDGVSDLLVTFPPPLYDESRNLARADSGNRFASPDALQPLFGRGERKIELDQPSHVIAQALTLLVSPLTQPLVQIVWDVLDLDRAHSLILACSSSLYAC